MKVIRLLIGVAALAGAAYFTVTVPLGNKTLWGHIKAAAGIRVPGDSLVGHGSKAGATPRRDGGSRSLDRVNDKDRRLLRKLIKEKLETSPAP